MRGAEASGGGVALAPHARLMHLVVLHINAVASAMRTSPRWALGAMAGGSPLSSASTSTTALSLTHAAGTLASSGGEQIGARVDPTGAAVPAAGTSASAPQPPHASVGLLGGFTVLRAQLRLVKSPTELPLPTLLAQFLRVILSARTTGTVTGGALEAVHDFLKHGLFRRSSDGIERAVQEVAHATSHCRFEPSTANVDEVVLLSILDVMAALVCGRTAPEDGVESVPLVDMLGDEGVCEVMETALSMCCQTRLSTALRRTAEQTVLRMTTALFERLYTTDVTADAAYAPGGDGAEPELATLMADRVGQDAEVDGHLRRMATPDPKSQRIPAAGQAGGAGDSAENAEGEDAGDAVPQGDDDTQREGPAATESAGEAPASEATAQASEAKPAPPTVQGEAAHAADSGAVVPPKETDSGVADPSGDAASPPVVPQSPFGLPALVEVLRVLVTLLDPQGARHTDTMRLLGLNVLAHLLDRHGSAIARFPTLSALLADSACRHLVQLAGSTNTVMVAGSLRVLNVLFDQLRVQLKLQQELFVLLLQQQLNAAAPAITPWATEAGEAAKDEGSSTGAGSTAATAAAAPVGLASLGSGATGELRELYLDTFTMLADYGELSDAAGSDFYIDLWRNYDCDMHCTNLYEQVVHFWCRAILAHPAPTGNERSRIAWSSVQLVALDEVLRLLARMAARLETPPSEAELRLARTLQTRRSRKHVLATCAAQFNAKPRDGIACLERERLIDTQGGEQARARSLARFLKESPGVDKRLLGDYLSRPENVAVLSEFIDLFDFRGIDVAEAMRALCEAFRLPGEAQQIARVTETFAHAYYASRPAGIRSEDAVYVLAYSIIMLNTDLHNPQVRRRMTVADYQKNLRGVNDGQDFDPEYLAQLYDSIRRREIVMPEEHAGQLGFDYTWKELLRRSRTAGMLERAPCAALDRDVFRASWRPFVAAIVHAFATLHDEQLLQRTIGACRQCALLARAYDEPAVFDTMVRHFARASSLNDPALVRNTAANATHRLDDKQSVVISPLSIEFGTNFKGQLAAVVLFSMANGNLGALRQGWDDLVAVLEGLLLNGLLPDALVQMHVFERAPERIPLRAKRGTAPAAGGSGAAAAAAGGGGVSGAGGGGLLSTLSSYFLSPYGGTEQPMDVGESDVESSLCTLDCLASCHVEELDAQLRTLRGPALDALLDAVSARLAPHLAQLTAPDAPRPVAYNACAVYLLELLARCACQEPEQLGQRWSCVFTPHRAVLERAADAHPLVLERAVVGALRLVDARVRAAELQQTADTPAADANTAVAPARGVLLDTLSLLASLPAEVHASSSRAVLGGLLALLRPRPHYLQTAQEWQLLLQVLGTYSHARRADTAHLAVDLGVFLMEKACVRENYAALVDYLRELVLAVDRSVWRSARESAGAPRRTLTEKRELGEWDAALRERSGDALKALERAKMQAPTLVRTASHPAQAWTDLWLPLIAGLAQQCVNAHRATRQAAVTHLERVVLAPEMLDPAPEPTAPALQLVFTNILFPLIETLLKPEMQRADTLVPQDAPGDPMAQTRAQVCLLLCKAWLQYAGMLGSEAQSDGGPAAARERFITLWCGVLDALRGLLAAKPADRAAHEAVVEQLKNVLRVMHAAQQLARPGEVEPDSLPAAVWRETWTRLDRVLPGLQAEVFPEAAPPAEAAPGPQAA